MNVDETIGETSRKEERTVTYSSIMSSTMEVKESQDSIFAL